MQIPSWAAVLAAPILAAVAVPTLPWPDSTSQPATVAPAAESPVMPAYDKDRALRLPDGYRQWVFVGSSLGLSYDAAAPDHEMFHETLMEPTAYRHFAQTGEFREGTMFVLMMHGTARAVLPGRRGQFAGAIHAVEMAVKDKTRTPEGWAYYGFGEMGGSITRTAQPEGIGCFNCHKTHAARDNVFLQFYPLLAEAARITVTPRRDAAAANAHPAPEPVREIDAQP